MTVKGWRMCRWTFNLVTLILWRCIGVLINFLPWTTKLVLSRLHCMGQQYIVWVKIIVFSFMTKMIRLLIRDHVP